MASLGFQKLIDFNQLPKDWDLVRLAVDWSGDPLLLMVEGKPKRPEASAGVDALCRWHNTPPRAHHLIHWTEGSPEAVCFEQSQGLSTFHIQPLAEGWLLGERRGGSATIYDKRGRVRAFLDLGDASEDLMTTPDGRVWVSYFDEGVYGGGMGSQGLVCFDRQGGQVFRYGEFADKSGLPRIDDCYAMNVMSSGDVWLNYYMDFPLVRLRDYALDRVWPEFGSLGSAFAIRGGFAIYEQDSHLMSRNLEEAEEAVAIEALDEGGCRLTPLCSPDAGIAARDSRFIINTGSAVYRLID